MKLLTAGALALLLSLGAMVCIASDTGLEASHRPDDHKAEARIPANAVEFNGNKYAIFDHYGSWDEAKQFCESLGGHLATIASLDENDFLYNYVLSIGLDNAYFGFIDEEENGIYKWVTGETVTFTNWHIGEPNNLDGTEYCAMFYYEYTDGTWNDGDFGGLTANGATAFICKWDIQGAHRMMESVAEVSSNGKEFEKQPFEVLESEVPVYSDFNEKFYDLAQNTALQPLFLLLIENPGLVDHLIDMLREELRDETSKNPGIVEKIFEQYGYADGP